MEARQRQLISGSRTPDATAEIRFKGKRRGTAVLVDRQHLLTAQHVVAARSQDDEPQYVAAFPASGIELSVEFVELEIPADVDVAVLRITEATDSKLPDPVSLWPDDRLPDKVAAFGYPGSERASEGVWRHFSVSGRTSTGMHQLQWDENVGTFVGHSGGPVVDVESGRLVGILVAGSEVGRFDRFVALPQIADVWSGLKRPWTYAGEGAQSHFFRRARGQRSRAQGGDLFQGREAALNGIASWTRLGAPGRPLVVVGQPGSGKSAVLGRAAMRAESAGGRGLVYHTRGSSLGEFLDAVASHLGLNRAQSTDNLIQEIDEQEITAPFTLMVDALDEARSLTDTKLIADALTELSRLPNVHVVVATRPMAVGDRFDTRPDGLALLPRLSVFSDKSPSLIDLDVEPFRDRAAIQAFVSAMLTQEDVANPGPANCAWEAYRSRPRLTHQLATIISERSDPNFLVAAITSMALATQDAVVDVDDPAFDPRAIPSNLGEALEKYYASISDDLRQQVTVLLTALAYGRGSGLSDARWVEFAKSLGYGAERIDIDHLRVSSGADYLLQTDQEDGEPTVRLFHQALVDQLRAGRPDSDELRIYRHLQHEVADAGGWGHVDSYLKTQIASHALACGQLDALLDDPEFIGVADVGAVVSTLEQVDPVEFPEIGHLIMREGHRLPDLDPAERLWLLAFSASQTDQFAVRDRILSTISPPVVPLWAHPLGSVYQKLTGHTAPICALAAGTLGGHDVIASGGMDREIRIWDRRGNTLIGPITGHDGIIDALTIGQIDGESVIVSGSADKSVRLWNQNGHAVGKPFLGHTTGVRIVQVIDFDGDDAIISVAPRGEIIIWNPEGHVLRRFPIDAQLAATGILNRQLSVVTVGFFNVGYYSSTLGHLWSKPVERVPKTAAAVGRLRTTDVVACSLQTGPVLVLRADGSTARTPLLGLRHGARALTIGRLGVTDVVAAASQDNGLVIWDFRGNVIAEPWAGSTGAANAVTIGRRQGRDVVACGGDDGTVRVWESSELLTRSRNNRRPPIQALAVGPLAGSFRIATGSGSRIEIWDDNGRPVGSPSINHGERVVAIAFGRLDDDEVIASIGEDHRIRVWSATGAEVIEPIGGEEQALLTMTAGKSDEGDVLAAAGLDGSVRIWGFDGRELARIMVDVKPNMPPPEFARIKGTHSLVIAGPQVVHIWDLADERWSCHSPKFGSTITSLAVQTIDEEDIVAVGCADGGVRTWQVKRGTFHKSYTSHRGSVTHLAWLGPPDARILVSNGWDAALRAWSSMDSCETFPMSEAAAHMAVHDATIVVASGPALARQTFDFTAVSSTSSWIDTSSTARIPFPRSDADGGWSPSKSRTRNLESARQALRLGQTQEAIELLLPELADAPSAVCLAADAAFSSGLPATIEAVMPYLDADIMRGQPTVQGKRFALAVAGGQIGSAIEAATDIGAVTARAAAGLVDLFAGQPEREWICYRDSLAGFLLDPVTRNLPFVRHIPILAAQRLLTVCQGVGQPEEGDAGLFGPRRDALVREYWSWFDKADEEQLIGELTRYLTVAPNFPIHSLAAQVISVYEVVRVKQPGDSALRIDLARGLARRIRTSPTEVRREFAAWSDYSELAESIISEITAKNRP